MAESRNCPQCDSMMDYRLGEYECPSCGHREPAQAVAPKQDARGPSGPGLLRIPPPPPGTVVPGMPGSYGYQAQQEEAGGRIRDAGLEAEKKYILVYLFCYYLLIGIWGANAPMNYMFDGAAFFFVMLFSALAGCGVLYFTLHSDQSWVKYSCMGCVGLGAISNLITLIVPTASSTAMALPPALQLVSALLGLIYAGWLLFILYRDVQA